MHRRLLLSFAILLGACGAEHDCTLIWCADGFSLRTEPSEAWPPGAYRFVIEADGETVTCTGSLPLPPCGTRAITCDRDDVVEIDESGCALPASQQAFSGLNFPGNPETVTIELQRDGSTLTRRTFTPAYQTTQPNGPGCEPICTQASDTFALALD